MSALRSFTCECPRRSCRQRIYLSGTEYTRLATLGRVVVPEHVDGQLVRSEGSDTFAVVKTAPRLRARDTAGRFA